MPLGRGMQTTHDQRIRRALWQLTAARKDDATNLPPLLFLRAPSIVCLWMASLMAVVGIVALGRIQIPRITRGAVVAVREESTGTALLLLLPASARAYVHPGQRAELESDTAGALALEITAVDSVLLDAPTAQRRFVDPASLIAQLDVPKLVVRLSPCGPHGCLTPTPGATFVVTTRTGTRSRARYALSSS